MSGSSILNINGLQVAYLKRNSDKAEAIIFIHGNSASSRFWMKQVNDPRLSGYRLIAIDLPAHGASGASQNPVADYPPMALGKTVAGIINMLGVDRYVLVGISFGTNVIAEALGHGIRPLGMCLASPCMVGAGYGLDKVFKSEVDTRFLFSHAFDRQAVANSYRESLPTLSIDDQIQIVDDYFLVKPPFRDALAQGVMAGMMQDEIVLLKQYGRPCLVVFGDDEKAIDVHYLDGAPFPIWQQIFRIPGGHFFTLDSEEAFNTLLAGYCRAVL
jgi:pimeloyl-ACP methyl ester carboxylesterase